MQPNTEDNTAATVADSVIQLIPGASRAKFRTKKEIGKLIRSLAPLPDVPDSIEPLRPALQRSLRRPTWEEFVQSFCPPVRELNPGERPSDWANDTALLDSVGSVTPTAEQTGLTTAPARVPDLPEVPAELPPVTGPQVYQMQFTTSEEHVELVELAKALLPNKASLGELHLQAMRLLVAALEKRRFGAGTHPRQRGGLGDRARSRYIPANKRRAVFERDEGRCTFVDESGQRCRETSHLQIHHLDAFAKGGTHDLSNMTLRCPAHNALAAEQDFGHEHIQAKRDSCRHESERAVRGVSSKSERDLPGLFDVSPLRQSPRR